MGRPSRTALVVLALAAAAACPPIRTRMVIARVFDPPRAIRKTPGDVGLPFTPIAIPTADGERLQAWWIPAKEGRARAHVLYCHGAGCNVGDRVGLVKLFAAEGFDVLLFDYRGFGESSGTPSEEGTYEDARAARAALARIDGVDAARIVYVGESLGGAVALRLAVQAPPRALVLQSTFTDLRAVARRHYRRMPMFLVPDMYRSADVIGRLRCPLLVAHGADDAFVPVEMGRALCDAAPGPKEMRVFPGVGHVGFLPNAGVPYVRAVSAWLRAQGL